jgi:hypothetical protein
MSGTGKSKGYRYALVFILAAFLLAAVGTNRSNAATISLGLTCPLEGLESSGSCSGGPSFGTVTLEDLSGADTGKVKVTVDLGMTGTQKFRDLMLNFAGAATTITENDAGNTVVLSAGNFSITPYSGTFDVGENGGQGWNATTSGAYMTVLSGNAPLSTSDFLVLDSGGNLYAALHIQDIGTANGETCNGTSDPPCAPGVSGPGSLKIGAPTFLVGKEVPEPTSLCLFGAAVMLVGLVRRRQP